MISCAAAQDGRSRNDSANIRVRSDLVLINALVTDAAGRVISDLGAHRFRVFEDGHEQLIRYFAAEDSPVSIGLVLDTSGSMGNKLTAVKGAAIRLIHSGNASDEYFLLEFRDRPEIVVPFTSDTGQLVSAVDSLEVGGSTALLDGIYLALQQVRRGKHPRNAVVVVSDGMDNHSRHSLKETRRLAVEADSPVFTVNMWEPDRSGNRYAIQRRDLGFLEEIARPTGGRSFFARDSKRLISAVEQIGVEIRHEYVIGYMPSNREADGRLRRIQLRLEPAGARQRLKLSYRNGYRAPVQ